MRWQGRIKGLAEKNIYIWEKFFFEAEWIVEYGIDLSFIEMGDRFSFFFM